MSVTFNPFTGTLDFAGGAGGGTTTPSAPDTSVQFNDGGSFGGDAALTWEKVGNLLTVDTTGSSVNGNVLAVPSDMPLEAQYWGSNDGNFLAVTGAANVVSGQGNKTIGTQGIAYLEDVDDGAGTAVGVRAIGVLDTESASTSGVADGLLALAFTGSGSAADYTNEINGVSAQASHGGSGTLTTAAALHAVSVLNTGGGTITTVYGLLVNNQSGGSTNYAIKTGAGLVAFGDQVNIAGGKGLLLSTTDPHVAGVLWNNSGLAVISSG